MHTLRALTRRIVDAILLCLLFALACCAGCGGGDPDEDQARTTMPVSCAASAPSCVK